MSKLTPEQVAERQEQFLNSPQYQLRRKQSEIHKIKVWFERYDQQVIQYLRSRRNNTEWTAVIDNKHYNNITELDQEAESKANEINNLKIEIATLMEQIKQEKIATSSGEEF